MTTTSRKEPRPGSAKPVEPSQQGREQDEYERKLAEAAQPKRKK